VTIANTTIKLTKYQSHQSTIGEVCTSREKFRSKGVIGDVAVIGVFYLLHIFEE
jgi:hypothetical protein